MSQFLILSLSGKREKRDVMIPKIIHYCWFGRGEMPQLALMCIESWREELPQYELRRWDEDSFDINIIPYVKEAYEQKKYAFVADYVRLYALYTCGGIYMDTDVEVLKNFDSFLKLRAFSGFESSGSVHTGLMAAEKDSKWICDLMSYYDDRHFLKSDGSMDLTTNVISVTNYMKGHGLVLDNSFQEFQNLVTIYPSDYFCPFIQDSGELKITQNSYCIHHFSGSWMPMRVRILSKIKRFIVKHTSRNFVRFLMRTFCLDKLKEKELQK